MTVENISWSISTKECCRPRRVVNPRPPDLQSDGASNWATEAGLLAINDAQGLSVKSKTGMANIVDHDGTVTCMSSLIQIHTIYKWCLFPSTGKKSLIWMSHNMWKPYDVSFQLRKHAYSNPGHTLLPIFPSFRPMGMVGEACLPSNAYYPRTPDYTLCSGVHVCWSEHSDSSFVYGFMILNYGFGTMTATTYIKKFATKKWKL